MQTVPNFFKPFESANFSLQYAGHEVHNNYKFIKGNLILTGRQPDGDSVAFIPDHIEYFRDVYRSYLLKPSSRDNSVQLRFEGIDAPELHYMAHFQPMGDQARDCLLLDIIGFNDVKYKPTSTNQPQTDVTGSNPSVIPVIIATSGLETHGRPISYVFPNDNQFEDGATAPLDPEKLIESFNYKMLESGFAYLLAYTSMPAAHYTIFKQVANNARSNNLGVWKNNATHDFTLTSEQSIAGENAQLIYPKLFRRCIDFLRSGESDLKEWLRKKDPENDMVRITESDTVSLSSLIQQVNEHVYFQADTNDIIFMEK